MKGEETRLPMGILFDRLVPKSRREEDVRGTGHSQQQGLRDKQYSGHYEAIQLWRGVKGGGNGVWCLFVWGVSVNDSPEEETCTSFQWKIPLGSVRFKGGHFQ